MKTPSSQISDELIWSLRALSQGAETQFQLYRCLDEAADEIVLDFESSLLKEDATFLKDNHDIRNLSELIENKSDVVGYWSKNAMIHSEFWAKIRSEAKEILTRRDLPLSAPEPQNVIFVNVDDASKSRGIFAKLMALIWR